MNSFKDQFMLQRAKHLDVIYSVGALTFHLYYPIIASLKYFAKHIWDVVALVANVVLIV